ncbi:alpha/beta fold hydrolase [Thiovibrio sp. JS02]
MKTAKNIATTVIHLVLAALLAGCGALQNIDREQVATVNSADGSAISYGVRGRGDVAIVFIHCWTCNHEFWQPQIEYFAENHRVAWLDLAGHGASGSNRRLYTMEAFGQDVAAVVTAMGNEQVILVGHSMGGPVAVEAAKLLGDRVMGIVGVDTFYTPSAIHTLTEEQAAGFIKPFAENFAGATEQMVRSMFPPNADPAVVDSILKRICAANQEMGLSAMQEIFRWHAANVPATLDRFADRLRNINGAPTGQETPLHQSVVLIPGVGHFVAQEKPDAFNKALDAIIRDLRRQ